MVEKNPTLSSLRLYLMRGLYFLTFIGLVFDNWSTILSPTDQMDTLTGVAISFWASYSLLMGLGVRYPIKMLPLLFLQLLYKSAWIIGTYLPATKTGVVDEDLTSFFWICVTAIVLDLLVIPWKFVFRSYVSGFLNVSASH